MKKYDTHSLFMSVQEVAAICGVGSKLAYQIINHMNEELSAMNKLVQSGKVQRTYFNSKIWNSVNDPLPIEPGIFMTIDEIADSTGLTKSFLYPKLREINADLKKRGYLVISGKLPRAYLSEILYK